MSIKNGEVKSGSDQNFFPFWLQIYQRYIFFFFTHFNANGNFIILS